MMDDKVKCLQKVDTVLNADSVEFCPYHDLEHILICGTYKLNESSTDTESNQSIQTRQGGVKVFHVQHLSEETDLSLKEVTSLEMCGVLDIKWPKKQSSEQKIFGLVDAEGYLQILEIDSNESKINAVVKGKLSDSSLGLSLEWKKDDQSDCGHIVCSDSAGVVTVFDLRESLNISSQWSAHDYEAWITAFHHFDRNIVYSGGDDCLFKTWDLRDVSRPVHVSRRHQMGVCSIQSHPLDENIIATGSYDEQLLIWDKRNPRQPLTDVSVGGGVWRIKWEPHSSKHILTATMYNGTHIIDCNDLGKNPLPILAHYDDHNLAYGADWCWRSKQTFLCEDEKSNENNEMANSFIISTCSFYDQSLHLWEWNNR